MQHVFIIGAKGLGNYGGYETFLDKLTEYHQNCFKIKYHIACKLNGSGFMDESQLKEIKEISKTEFIYHNAHCFKLYTPDIGSAQAILYDIKALNYCCKYIDKNQIYHPIVYVLSSRVGPAIRHFVKKIHKYGGIYIHNPDGRESCRGKYSQIVRKYWKVSERLMVKYADLEICDSKNIEKYISKEYVHYMPKTSYIAYGADVRKSTLADDDPVFLDWIKNFKLAKNNYYLVVGRFVPENNYETMIREFMSSNSKKVFVIITNVNKKFLEELQNKLQFKEDKRIKFVGTVYNQELLKKIRENAFGYIHGHEVGGTNPSLLEALGSTSLNLLLDVGFNREVGEEGALYWTKEEGNLAALINNADKLAPEVINEIGIIAKKRIVDAYSWELIAQKYRDVFLENCFL